MIPAIGSGDPRIHIQLLPSALLKASLAAEITAAKLRSGAPAALAGLCEHRGAAVFAYCRRIAGDDAAAVAAEAFAEFRRAIQAPGSLTSGQQAEALLRGVTHRAALSYLRGAADPAEPPPAADLQRLQDAEPAFEVAHGTPVPVAVSQQILTAMVRAAPVESHGDETAVRDEALRLLTADAPSSAAAVEPPPPPPPVPLVEPPPRPAEPPLQPGPEMPQERPAATSARTPRRPRLQLPPFGRVPFAPGRSARLLRGVVKLAAVVAVASAVGIGLGIGIAELTSDDDAPAAPAVAPTSSTPSATTATSAATAPAATTKVRVEVLSATARPPADGAAQGARLAVRARVANDSGRTISPKQPALLVDDLRVAVAPESSSTATALLAPSLATGATAEGTLRFDIPTATPSDLTIARVRLQISGKFIVLSPKLAQPASAG